MSARQAPQLAELLGLLRNARDPWSRLRLVAQGARALSRLTPAQRGDLLRTLGLEGAEELAELAAGGDPKVAQTLEGVLRSLESDPRRVEQIARDIADPRTRKGTLTGLAAHVMEVVTAPPPAPPDPPPPVPPVPPAAAGRPAKGKGKPARGTAGAPQRAAATAPQPAQAPRPPAPSAPARQAPPAQQPGAIASAAAAATAAATIAAATAAEATSAASPTPRAPAPSPSAPATGATPASVPAPTRPAPSPSPPPWTATPRPAKPSPEAGGEAAVTPPARVPPAAAPPPAASGAEAEPEGPAIARATGTLGRLRSLRRSLGARGAVTSESLHELLDHGLDSDWARRRALTAAFASGVPAGLDEALALVARLAAPSARQWALGDLAASRAWSEAEWERLLAAAASPVARRRLASLRGRRALALAPAGP